MQILLDAVADARRGGLHGIAGKVGIPGGRLHRKPPAWAAFSD